MRAIIILLGLFSIGIHAQNTKKKDTVKTEVVEIETRYNPKIADANKIIRTPKIEILNKSKKKKLNYSIFSAPVASTFIPKTGVVKGIDVGAKERLYNNYLALGYGNYASPYMEAYVHHNIKFDNAFGLHLRYNASFENIGNTSVNSNFSNIYSKVFYKQEERFFDWKVALNAERNTYNWYGLPNLNFIPSVINFIEEEQQYNSFGVRGEIIFEDSKIENIHVDANYFTDAFNSSEFFINGTATFQFPVDFLARNARPLQVKTGIESVVGRFQQSYSANSPLDYHFINAYANPNYKFNLGAVSIDLGTSLNLSFDIENDLQHFLIYPNIIVEAPIVRNFVSLYGGVTGGLHNNSYRGFTEQNPFVSPTLFITQTNERTNYFAGLRALATNDLSFHFSASRKDEEDKPLFLRNNSKSDDVATMANGLPIKGYEFGNSFGVVYDDIITTSFLAEMEFEASKHLSISTNVTYNIYETSTAQESWNLPELEVSFLAKYTFGKWYATGSVNYIGDRKDAIYSSIYPSSIIGTQQIKGFVDANLNGGYHFNDKFTIFLKINNFINGNYQQFANFNVQGFQAIGGLSYKFDF